MDAVTRWRRAVERPGALRPVVAAAMIRLVDGDGTTLDPCCGTGTIAVEASAVGRTALAGDLDPLAVAAATANGVAPVLRLDARRLPLPADSVGAVVTNVPFGRRHLVQGDPVAWYRRVLAEALRVAPQAVVLAASTQPFRQALGKLDVDVSGRHRIELLGNRTTIWDIRRR
jgi:tRNA G10  N-methylase Trm11